MIFSLFWFFQPTISGGAEYSFLGFGMVPESKIHPNCKTFVMVSSITKGRKTLTKCQRVFQVAANA